MFVNSEAFNGMARIFAFLLIIGIPLALWKLVDIAVWLFNNVEIGLK